MFLHRIDACASFVASLRIRGHARHSRHQHGLGISFQREYFLCAGLRFVSFQQLGFAHLQLIRLWLRQRLMRFRFRISPWSSLLRWVLYPCVDSVFFPADSSHGIHYHFIHMLAIATKFISVAVQPFVPPHRRSVSPTLSAARLALSQADQSRTLEQPR